LATALSVFAEPLVEGARVLVVGPPSEELAGRLHELGAGSVHGYDPTAGELDVRDGAFDFAIVPDLGRVGDPAAAVRRLRRLVGSRGAILAMGRALTSPDSGDDGERDAPFPELVPAVSGYAQLYDVFALQFEHVAMTGVLPFSGVVFAELGAEEPAVSVDTRLVDDRAPGVFVVFASANAEGPAVEPYAIVQVPHDDAPRVEPSAPDAGLVAALAAEQLRASTLAAQLEEANTRAELVRTEASRRGHDRTVQMTSERDAIIARATELESLASAQQQAIATLERRLEGAERHILERDDLNAALQGEIDALRREGVELSAPDPEALDELVARAQRAESALALNVADLAHVAEAHARETALLEAQLRERARLIAGMEKELARREHLVRELVAALEEAREGGGNGVRFEEARAETAADPEELGRLHRKIDELAMEVARRDGELVAREWKLAEIQAAPAPPPATPPPAGDARDVREEIDALRQALTQEHAARIAAESGEELARARAELARQAALLEQIRNAPKAS
jgi:hypothetical protein